MVNLDNWSY